MSEDHHHNHDCEHDHAHHEDHESGNKISKLMLSMIVTIIFVAVEGSVGFVSHSLALISDAGHNFSDAVALIFSAFAIWMARRPSDSRRTFGYHRATVLSAFANAIALIAIAFFIFSEAAARFRHPEAVSSDLMIGMALAAVVINGAIGFWLHGHSHDDLNMKSATIHMIGDALSAAGVVVAGIVIKFTHVSWVDPLASCLIGLFILKSSWGILNECLHILMESVPYGLNLADVEAAIRAVPDVLNVHDLHVWLVASGRIVCSCHLQVSERSVSSGQKILKSINEVLRDQFKISHTTIQVEVENCDPDSIYCAFASKHHAKHH